MLVVALSAVLAIPGGPDRFYHDHQIAAPRRQILSHHQPRLGPAVHRVERLDAYAHVKIPGELLLNEMEAILIVPNVRAAGQDVEVARARAEGDTGHGWVS